MITCEFFAARPLAFRRGYGNNALDMCGIAGIIDFRGRAVEPAVLQRFRRALAHRGPDDTGDWTFQTSGFSAAFAHTRLAVIDPTPQARQPMTSPDRRYAITYNGELYNYRDLARDLPGPLHTTSDTEVVLQACIHWGPTALNRFDAMWALAFVDTVEHRGHLSRDPFGIKPLYYTVSDDRLIFASELRALCQVPGLSLAIDPQALACYLNLGYIPHPQTIYRHVFKLPPGHRLDFDAAGVGEPERFFYLPEPPAAPPPYHEAARELRGRIETAVAAQRVSDVPLGAFLSGGLDSSIVVACLARAAGPRVKTFSIGYREHPRYDETHYARLLADRYSTEHHAFQLSFHDVLDAIEPMLDHLGEPFADSSLLPTALVSQYTRQHVTVALSGDGGDELFGGYWRYLGHHYLKRYHRLPKLIRKTLIEPLLRRLPAARSSPLLNRLRQASKLLNGDYPDPFDRHLAWARYMDDDLATEFLGRPAATQLAKDLKEMYRHAATQCYPQETDGRDDLTRILLADLAIGLPADMLFKVDTASMFHGLEVRVPLLSVDVVNFAAALPIEYKIAGSNGKRILRDAFADDLPAPILQRKKMGFEVPVGEFLRNELRDFYRDTVTATTLQNLNLNPATAARLFDDHLHRRADHADLLWSLLVLTHWAGGPA